MTTTTRTSAAPLFFFNDTATTEIYTLSLHDAPPIWSESDKEIKRETLRGAIGGEACQHAPEPLTVFPDDGEHRAGLDHDLEYLCLLIGEAKQVADEDQVSGRRDRQKLGQALHDTEDENLCEQREFHCVSRK